MKRYSLLNDHYIFDHQKDTHLSLKDVCEELNSKENVIIRLFNALTKK